MSPEAPATLHTVVAIGLNKLQPNWTSLSGTVHLKTNQCIHPGKQRNDTVGLWEIEKHGDFACTCMWKE